jgi:alkaline phosphatase D
MALPLTRCSSLLLLPVIAGCISRFSPPPKERDPGPVDTADSLMDATCSAATVGPLVSAVTDTAATVMVRTDAPCRLQVEASTSSSFEDVVTASTSASYHGDLTAHARLEGLEPGTAYHYRLMHGGEPLELPSARSFTTALSPDEPASFTFGVVSDATTNDGNSTIAYEQLGLMEPAFVLQIGDLDHRDPGTYAPWDAQIWREMHQDQLARHMAGQTLDRTLLASAPFFHTWDDHDFGNNDADGMSPWKDLSLMAFLEYYPLPPDAPNLQQGIWYSFRWGQAEVIMLDLRSQRSPNDTEDGPDKSMLDHHGIELDQLSWLYSRLTESDATWKIIVSSSCWNPYGKQNDSWAGYQNEQHKILWRMVDLELTGVLVISGDMHSGGGIDDGFWAGLPEMTVPSTNITQSNCTGGYCGTWSEGIQVGDDPAGFSTVTLSYDAASGEHRALLQTWSEAGDPRLSLELTPEQAVPRQTPVYVGL